MKNLISNLSRFRLVTGLALLLAVLPMPLVAQEVCSEFPTSGRIQRFGTNSISSERADDLADLQRLAILHRDELVGVLEARRLGHLADKVFAAIAGGQVTERQLERGEEFAWMALRRNGDATSVGPLCFASQRQYEAFEIRVTEESVQPATATCSLRATGDCSASTLRVDATGSSSGVRVTMGDGSQNLLSSGSTTWDGPFDDRFVKNYSFTAKADAAGTRKVTTHTFVIPKVCLNLAYNGRPEVAEERLADSCTATAEVKKCDATPPAVAVSAANIKRSGKSVTIDADGHGDKVVEITDAKGRKVAEVSEFPAKVDLPRPGKYKVKGTSTNEVGETATFESEITVDPSWTARAYAGRLYPSGDLLMKTFDNNGVEEVTKLYLREGEGIGGDLEYHVSPTLGLQGSLFYGKIDTFFMFDSLGIWEHDNGDGDFLSLTFGPTFHLFQGSRADVYLGPFVGYIDLGNSAHQILGRSFDADFKGDLGYGALLGVDIGLGATRLWGLHFGTRYYEFDSDGNDPIGVDPLQLEVGFRRHF